MALDVPATSAQARDLSQRRLVGTMSEPRPGPDTTPLSAQHTGTRRAPLPALLTYDTQTFNDNNTDANISLPGQRNPNDGYSPSTNDSSERDSGLDQTSTAGSSLQSRPVHGKIACQECVSVTSADRDDV
jgi:hypothetical protein